jgi:hypothetical protein
MKAYQPSFFDESKRLAALSRLAQKITTPNELRRGDIYRLDRSGNGTHRCGF